MKIENFFTKKRWVYIVGGMILSTFYFQPHSFGEPENRACSFYIDKVLSEIAGGAGGPRVEAKLKMYMPPELFAHVIGEPCVLYGYDRSWGRRISVIPGIREGSVISFKGDLEKEVGPANSMGILKCERDGKGVAAYVGALIPGTQQEFMPSDFTEELASVSKESLDKETVIQLDLQDRFGVPPQDSDIEKMIQGIEPGGGYPTEKPGEFGREPAYQLEKDILEQHRREPSPQKGPSSPASPPAEPGWD